MEGKRDFFEAQRHCTITSLGGEVKNRKVGGGWRLKYLKRLLGHNLFFWWCLQKIDRTCFQSMLVPLSD
jgi:hypothetical protein